MDSLKLTLTSQTSAQFISIGDLTVDRAYPILKMSNKDTQYGRPIIYILKADEGAHLETYLTKSVQLEDDEIFEFNARTNKNLNLKYIDDELILSGILI